MAAMKRILFFFYRAQWIYYFKVGHHTGSMMFYNMTMIHPFTRAVIRHPGDFDRSPGFQIVSILPCFVFRRFTIFFQYPGRAYLYPARFIYTRADTNGFYRMPGYVQI